MALMRELRRASLCSVDEADAARLARTAFLGTRVLICSYSRSSTSSLRLSWLGEAPLFEAGTGESVQGVEGPVEMPELSELESETDRKVQTSFNVVHGVVRHE